MQAATLVAADKRSSQTRRGRHGGQHGGPRKPAPLLPAQRGERICLCSGTLQETKGHYGWIMPDVKIDHAESKKHRGGIYLDTKDIRPGAPLRKGDIVSFYLFVDSTGLGAEDCRIKNADAPRPEAKAELYQILHPRAPAPAPKPAETPVSGALEAVDVDTSCRSLDKQCKLEAEAESSDDGASTAFGSHSPGGSSGSCSSLSSPSFVTVMPDFSTNSSGESSVGLMQALRAELREARARAERAGANAEKSGVATREMELVQMAATDKVHLPPGFRPPPGLLAPPAVAKLVLPTSMEAPPGFSNALAGISTNLQAPPGLFAATTAKFN